MSLWSPDTCGCQIEYTDDGNFTFIKSWASCSRHSANHGVPAHLATVLGENQKKNLRFNAIKSALPETSVMWSIDATTGEMSFRVAAATAAQLQTLRSANPDVTITVDPSAPDGS